MRRKYTCSKKVLYIFSICQKDLRRCEGSLKELYTPRFTVELSTFICYIFDTPVVTGSYSTPLESSQILQI